MLMGVRRSGVGDIIFNPGINHVMKSDDICYYISETREEHSDFRVVKPTLFQEGLWKSSAMLGLLALNVADIRPEQLFGTHSEGNEGVYRRFPSFVSEYSRKISTTSTINENDLELGVVGSEDIEDELDEQLRAEATNWQHDISRGIQLLRYHGGERKLTKPTIKYTVHANRFGSLGSDAAPPLSPHSLEPIPEIDVPVVVVEASLNRQTSSKSTKPQWLHRESTSASLFVDDRRKNSKQLSLALGDNGMIL